MARSGGSIDLMRLSKDLACFRAGISNHGKDSRRVMQT